MSWYRTGVVDVVQNSTAVTGIGTTFAANGRVGDAFLGPDGRWYEVVNIASDTLLSIMPAYRGDTVNAGDYSIAPMQGYVKVAADQLRSVVSEYGGKLAALGETANYDILPIANGGTGGSDGSSALAALGALPLSGGTLRGTVNRAPPTSLASAASVSIGAAAANTISITGTTTVTSFDVVGAGARRTLIFANVLTLVHNATSLILPGAVNIICAPGDVAEMESLGSGNWKCLSYFRAAEIPDVVRSVAQGGTGANTPQSALSNIGGAPRKNLLINGNFDVWQRGASATGNGYLSADRWAHYASVSTHTISRQPFAVGQSGVPNNPNWFLSTAVVSGNTASSFEYLAQGIEDVTLSSGRVVTLSFWAMATTAGKSLSFDFYQSFGTNGSGSVTGIGAAKVTLTTGWVQYTATVSIPSVLGKTIGTNNALFVRFWLDAGANYAVQASSLGNQSLTLYLSQVKVEYGSLASDWEPRSYAEELRLCQRYYERVNGTVATNQPRYFLQRYKVDKRAVPALTLVSGSTGGADYINGGADSFGSLRCPAGTLATTDADWVLASDAEI